MATMKDTLQSPSQLESSSYDGKQSSTKPLMSSRKHKEFLCGFGAALINVTCTFPINKIMFRQMIHNIGTIQAIKELKQEGLRFLYRGLFPPLIQKALCVSIMFGSYNSYSNSIKNHFPNISNGLCLTLSAIMAGSTEAFLTPFERTQTILQDPNFHGKFRNTFHAFHELKKYGIKELYRGYTPILLRNGPSNVLFFSLRDKAKSLLPETNVWYNNLVADFLSGALLGAFISTTFYPVNVVKSKMQICYGTPFVSFYQTFKIVYAERGLVQMFHGVHVNYTRALLSWGIINASYEVLMKTL